jgi:hypothetical protein
MGVYRTASVLKTGQVISQSHATDRLPAQSYPMKTPLFECMYFQAMQQFTRATPSLIRVVWDKTFLGPCIE